MNRIPNNLRALGVSNWPYSSSEGVGLRFSGLINDTSAFTELMAEYGCHPKAAARIIERLRCRGATRVTIRDDLPDCHLREQLCRLGIVMTVIPPQRNWKPRFNDGEWPRESLPKWLQRN